MPPHECANIFAVKGDQLIPLHLGFAFTDCAGVWGPATADPPNSGTDNTGKSTFTRSGMRFCVAHMPKGFFYHFYSSDIATHCHDIQGTQASNTVTMFGFPPALYFSPRPPVCSFFGSCTGGNYYVDIEVPAHGHQLIIRKGFSPEQKGWKIIGDFLQAVIKASDKSRQRHEQEAVNAAQAQLQHARDLQAAREDKQKQILAAEAAGDRGATVEAQMIRREQEDNRQRWAGSTQAPAAYPKWKEQNVAIVGTVPRVEVDPSGSPQWVSIYFKESPYCASKASKGSIRVVDSTQWKIH